VESNEITHAHSCDEITNMPELKWKNVIIVNNIDKFSSNDIGIGYRIDAIVVDIKYQNSKQLSDLIWRLMPNMTVDGFLKVNVFYCNDLNK
jgi:hypothetical protein